MTETIEALRQDVESTKAAYDAATAKLHAAMIEAEPLKVGDVVTFERHGKPAVGKIVRVRPTAFWRFVIVPKTKNGWHSTTKYDAHNSLHLTKIGHED